MTTSLINYLLEVNAGLVLAFLGFWLMLRNETDFRVQRGYLLISVAASLLLPLVHVTNTVTHIVPSLGATTLPELVVSMGARPEPGWTFLSLVGYVYVSVVFLMAVPMMRNVWQLRRQLYDSKARYEEGHYVIESPVAGPSWSFFNTIWIGGADSMTHREKEMIVMHEKLHSRLLHSADIVFTTLCCLAFWFNPAIWALRRSLIRVHEFQVDQLVADRTDRTEYCLLLAQRALTANSFFLAHHFNQSFIIKRINMMNMIKSRISNWKVLTLATSLALYGLAVSCTEQVKEIPAADDVPVDVSERLGTLSSEYPAVRFRALNVPVPALGQHMGRLQYVSGNTSGTDVWIVVRDGSPNEGSATVVDEMAAPAGGLPAFYEHLASTLVYPDAAANAGLEGKVFVEFVVLDDGRMADFQVLKGLSPECDAEAVRALTQYEKRWNPGILNGEPVEQKLVLPITFKLD